jgi:hypothetical protein
MSNPDFWLSIETPLGVHSHEENFARTLDLMRRLANIHPLLSQVSLADREFDWDNLLNEPLVRDISLEEWITRFDKNMSDNPNLGSTISFWNRHSADNEKFIIAGTYNDQNIETIANSIVISHPLNQALIEKDLLDDIMIAVIDSFGANCGYYHCTVYEPEDYNHCTYTYKLWLRDGEPYPKRSEATWCNEGPPILSESWHCGTRYMWPEYEPRAFLGLDKLPDA